MRGGNSALFRRIWTAECGLPGKVYDLCLGSLPEPTESKWQILYEVCRRLTMLCVKHPAVLVGGWMIEDFLNRCLSLLRGTVDTAMPQKAGQHGCRDKIEIIAGAVGERDFVAAMFMLVDLWEENFASFHKAMRSPSEFGGFKHGHIRHEMAVHSLGDLAYYDAAVEDPKKALPSFFKFIESSHRRGFAEGMTDTKRKDLIKRAIKCIEVMREQHIKWNGTTWTHARHLLGALTSSSYGQLTAGWVLEQLGEGAALASARGAGPTPQARDAVG